MKRKKLFIKGVIISAIFVLLTIVIFKLIITDEPKFNDLHLRPVRKNISSRENAFEKLLLAAKKVKYTKDKDELLKKILYGRQKLDQSVVNKIVKENKDAIMLLKDAIKKKYLQVPIVKMGEKCFYIMPWCYLAKIYALQSCNLFYQGKEEQAFDNIFDLIYFGNMVRESGGGILHYVSGLTIMKLGFETINLFLNNTSLRNEVLFKYKSRLDKYKINDNSLVNSLKAEYLSYAKQLDSLKKLGKYNPILFKPNLTKRMIGNIFTQIIKIAKSNYCKEYSIDKKLKIEVGIIDYLRNIMGYKLALLTKANEIILIRKCEVEVYYHFTQLAFAIKCYKNNEGKYPEKLNDLIPDYIKTIPLDPFDGKKIKYNKKKKLLYSVGYNHIDDKGDIKKDYVFSINFKN